MHTPGELLRKVLLLAVVGFAVVTLSGPIVAVLSLLFSLSVVVLGFALVGFCIWLPIHLVVRGHHATQQHVQYVVRGAGNLLQRAAGTGVRVITWPPRTVARLAAGTLHLAGRVIRGGWSTARVLSEVAIVTLTGALAGVLMAFLTSTPGHELETAVATNAVAGGLIGAASGIFMMIRERRQPLMRTPVIN